MSNYEKTLINGLDDPLNLGVSYWSYTNIASIQARLLTKIILNQVNLLHWDANPLKVRLVDIGTGSGHLIRNIVDEFLKIYSNSTIELYLIDKKENLALESYNNIVELNNPNVYVKYFSDDISNFLYYDFLIPEQDNSITIVNLASTLHELNYYQKNRVLRWLRCSSDLILITELEAKHDLIYSNDVVKNSAIKFYKILKEDVFSSDLSFFQKKQIVKFLDFEHQQITENNSSNRGNYHLMYSDWEYIFKKNRLNNFCLRKTIDCYSDQISFFISALKP